MTERSIYDKPMKERTDLEWTDSLESFRLSSTIYLIQKEKVESVPDYLSSNVNLIDFT